MILMKNVRLVTSSMSFKMGRFGLAAINCSFRSILGKMYVSVSLSVSHQIVLPHLSLHNHRSQVGTLQADQFSI